MIDVSNDLGYYLNNATHREKKLVGVLLTNGEKRCFLEYNKFNDLEGKKLFEFYNQKDFDEWYDS